ncbi:MAG: acyl--CoA ligase [Deltaproteobacteria bacterium]|nr:acyl--CoA ligase [Deltaproteobacteria bacterium]
MVESYMAQGLWTLDTTVSALQRLAKDSGQTLAGSDAHRRLTWAEIERESCRVGSFLRRLGLKRGELVLVQLPNCVENLVLRFALKRVGLLGVYIPVVWREAEMQRVVRLTGARALVAPSRFLDIDYHEMFKQFRLDFPELRWGIFVRGDVPKSVGTFCWEELAGTPAKEESGDAFEPWEVSLISVSSGSTGAPKLCEWPEAAQLLTGRGLAELLEISSQDVVGIFCPLGGGAGAMGWLAAVAAGARMVLGESFHAEEILGTMERERVSLMCTVPSILLRILDLPDLSRWDLSALRLIRTGTAAVVPATAREAERRLGARIVPAAGSMEAITFTQTSPHDPPEIRLEGFVGKPLPGGEVRIIGEGGVPVGPGQVGELEIRGAYTGSGYFRDPEATRAAWGTLGPEGWFRTGDLALMTSDGIISIVGRVRDVVNRGGRKVFPAELESILMQHPSVLEAVVVGIPHERLGEATRACVVPRNGQDLTEDEIRKFLESQQIATYKFPDEIRLVPELPRLPGGKVDRKNLASRELGSEEWRP